MPCRLAFNSPKRRGPSISSRITGSAQRSPIMSMPWVAAQASSYRLLPSPDRSLVIFCDCIVAFYNYRGHEGQIPSRRKPGRAEDPMDIAMQDNGLRPAPELARNSKMRIPNESEEYRRARTALLAEEIELRRHIERVAEQRRALPPGGEVRENYVFEGPDGPVTFADLFGDKDTLAIYNYMFGPQRERPCPMCTSLLSAWDGEIPDITQRIAF